MKYASLSLAAVLFALPARAQTDPVAAQALFDDAKRLMASGHAAEACPKLAESQRLDPGVGTLLNLGDCYDQIGKPSRAWATFREAEAAAQHEGQPERVRYAKRRVSETEAKLVRLTVDVPADVRIASLEVLRDGEMLREPLWGSALPVDPGDHLVEARAPGYKGFESRVTATHDPIVVRVTPLEREAPQTVEPPPPVALTTPPVTFESERRAPLPPPPPAPSSSSVRTAGLVTGGIGLAGVAVGALFGVLAIDRDNAARGAGCDATTCPTTGALGLSNDAKTFALASDVAFVAGGVFIVTGIVPPRVPALCRRARRSCDDFRGHLLNRRLLLVAVFAPSLACEAILGLHDRTLRDGGGDVVVVDASSCDGAQCACTHAFCDNFDSYKTVQDIQQHWSVPSVQNSLLQLNGTLTLDPSTVEVPPTPPNALLTTVNLPNPLQGAGFVIAQVDASAPPAGVHIAFLLNVVALDPSDAAPPILDGGASMLGAILALVDFTSKNGVGIALSEQGGYVGYALDLLQAGSRIAQGKQFYFDNPKTLNQLNQYVRVDFYVAKRSAITLPVQCTQGPVFTDVDGDIPDAALPPDPVVVVVQTAFTPPECEIVGGELVFPTWLASPVVMLGSVVKGQGLFSVEYDNFTLDFL